MTWTAPQIDRVKTIHVAEEREMLQTWLDHHRQTLLLKCTGLTADQLKLASAEPSNLTLLGLVRHMAEVERWWFRVNILSESIDHLYCTEEFPDGDFDLVAGADAEKDFDIFNAEIRACDELMREVSLDTAFLHPRRKTEMSVRWVYVHMIEEYARHNRHADLIRERIDGETGT